MATIPIKEVLESTGIYTAYFEIESEIEAPYIVWRGKGQNNFIADDTFYFKMGNTYEVDYYFLEKSEDVEDMIEQKLLVYINICFPSRRALEEE